MAACTTPHLPLALIVEDDRDTREMYAESLAFMGVRVIASRTAEDAIEKARTLHPDIIATDLGLPGNKDGGQLALELKQEIKPVVPADLFNEIQRLLGSK